MRLQQSLCTDLTGSVLHSHPLGRTPSLPHRSPLKQRDACLAEHRAQCLAGNSLDRVALGTDNQVVLLGACTSRCRRTREPADGSRGREAPHRQLTRKCLRVCSRRAQEGRMTRAGRSEGRPWMAGVNRRGATSPIQTGARGREAGASSAGPKVQPRLPPSQGSPAPPTRSLPRCPLELPRKRAGLPSAVTTPPPCAQPGL